MKFLLRSLLALCLLAGPANAANNFYIRDTFGNVKLIACTESGSPPVCTLAFGGSVSATFTSFTPTGAASLAVTTTSARVALPNANTTVVLQNTGTANLFYKLGTVAVVATTGDYSLPAGYSIALTISTETHVAAITAAGSTTLNVTQGTGTPQMTGGGGGGAGGGGGDATAANQVTAQSSFDTMVTNLSLVGNATKVQGTAVPTAVVMMGVSDGTNAARVFSSSNLADNVTGANMLPTGNWVWDGATWDRWTGAVTVGALPAGTNNIGDIDVLSSALPTGASTAALQTTNTTAVTALTAAVVAGTVEVGDATNPSELAISAFPAAGATGGATPYTLSAAASTNATVVKAAPGNIYHVEVYNNSATKAYLKFYNKATTPTCNSDTVVWKISVPASTDGAGVATDVAVGLAMSAGISFCLTSGFANTDTASVAASAFSINIGYR